MNVIKRMLSVILSIVLFTGISIIPVYAINEPECLDVFAVTVADPKVKANRTGTNNYTLADKRGNNYVFVEYDFEGINSEFITKAIFKPQMYSNKTDEEFTVSRVTSEWNENTGEFSIDESTSVSTNCGWQWNTRTVDITDLVKDCENDKLVLCIYMTGEFPTFESTSDGDITFGAASNRIPKLELTIDAPPTLSRVAMLGTPAENFDLNVTYDFSSELYDEGETEIEWLYADDADGNNEQIESEGITVTNGIANTLTLDEKHIGKYVRAKITPYSEGGFYVKGGKEHSNIYYTDYIGPIKSSEYLNELAADIENHVSTIDELYDYLYECEGYFELGIEELLEYDKYEQVLGIIADNPPENYSQLLQTFNLEFLTIKIESADAEDIEELLYQTGLEFEVYDSISDKNFIHIVLEGETFDCFADLEEVFDKAIAGAKVLAETSDEKLVSLLMDYDEYFTTEISSYSLGELLQAGQYIIESDKTMITDFGQLDELLSNAVLYGETNYTAGYITKNILFLEDMCIKTDYSQSTEGVNSVVDKASEYRIFGTVNAENYTQHMFMKLDVSGLLDYHIKSATLNLYGTVGGGANKTMEIVLSPSFDNANDFVEQFPRGTDIVKGESLGTVKYSYGTTEWQKLEITDYISELKNAGDEYAYLMIDFNSYEEGGKVANGGRIYTPSLGGEFAPYVEIVYETPPIVKNIELRGVKSVGSELTAEYDYYGCYEEDGTIFNWYSADKVGEDYENKTLIAQNAGSVFKIKEEHAEKFIMVEIKPCSTEGVYKEGEFETSDYTLPVLTSQASTELTEELNSAIDISTVLNDSEKTQYLDLDINTDMQKLETDGKTKVLSILTNTSFTDLNHFKSYYAHMINVQQINEAEYEELDEIIRNNDMGTNLNRYVSFEDNKSIIDAVYNKNFESVESYQTAYNEACSIYEFNAVNQNNVQELLLAYDFMFSQDVSSYDDDKLELVGNFFMTEIQNKKGSFSTIQTALTNAVNSAENYTPEIDTGEGEGNNGSSSGSSGGSSGGKNKEVSVPANPVPSEGITQVVETKVFNDLESVSSWAEDSILILNQKGILSGDGNGNFRPNDYITREEFVKVAVLAFDIQSDGEGYFKDVDANAWYKEYVNTAVTAGIINGVGDNLFGTGMEITREDMCTIIYRIMLNKNLITENETSSDFVDEAQISNYAKNAVAVLSSKGIVNGVGDDSFLPKGKATRAMVAVLIERALNIEN